MRGRILQVSLAIGLVLLWLGLLPAPIALGQSPGVPLMDAIRQGMIEAEFHGSGEPFWQDSISYTLTNKRSAPITILVPAGLILEPTDSSYQSMVVGKDYTIVLCGTQAGTPAPRATPCADSTAQGEWNAFCTNLSKHAPDEETVFRTGNMASGALAQVIQSVQRKGATGRLGAQFAVWRVTDNFTLESISAGSQNSELIQIIVPLLGLARPEIDLAQSILDDSNTGLKFYSGTPPPNLFDPGGVLAPGTRTGIPEVDSLKQQAEDAVRNLMVAGGVIAGLCVCVALGLVGAVAFLVLRRK